MAELYANENFSLPVVQSLRRLHRESDQHAGIIACTFDPDFEQQGNRIHAAVQAAMPLARKLIRVNRLSITK